MIFFLENYFLVNGFKKAKLVASFLSIKSEIPTKFLNDFIENKGKILCLPVITKENERGLIFKSYSKGEDLIIGKFNVQEPNNNKIYLPDIIFTPCLAFDLNGYRLGYGGGYYDKTISYLYSIRTSFSDSWFWLMMIKKLKK